MSPENGSVSVSAPGSTDTSSTALPASYRIYTPVHRTLTALGSVRIAGKHPSIILRNRINRLLYRSVFTRRREQTILTRDGFLIRVPLHDQAAAAIVFERAYSPAETAILRRLLEDCALFIDVGANLGYFSLLACALNQHRDDFAAVAIEPNAALCRLIRTSFELNGFDCAQVVQAAAGREAGCGYFQVQDNLSSSGRAFMDANGHAEGAVPVEFVRIDDLAQYDSATAGSIVVKVDVEGGEVDALAGAADAMRHGAVFMCEVWAGSLGALEPILMCHDYVMMDQIGNRVDSQARLPGRTDLLLLPASRFDAIQLIVRRAA